MGDRMVAVALAFGLFGASAVVLMLLPDTRRFTLTTAAK
jgi:hypothetical protein